MVADEPPALPTVTEPVAVDGLLGSEAQLDHYDDAGYPESRTGLLVIEQDPVAGPVALLRGDRPHYVEAQFVNTQRDAVWLARKGAVRDTLPTGEAYEIPYGYGAVKRTSAAITLIEAQMLPHVSDNQKRYQIFPLSDVYFGAELSLAGLRAELRYVEEERYVGYLQLGGNLPGLVGLEFNRTFAAFGVPLTLGGGVRYPALFRLLGSHWTSGGEFTLGLISIDDDPETTNAIALPGVFQEFEWAFERELNIEDPRADPRPHDYGVQALYLKLSAYADFFGGAGHGLLFDIHLGYRFNFAGPDIPEHPFKETRVTYASERYARRKREEGQRQQELEQRWRTTPANRP